MLGGANGCERKLESCTERRKSWERTFLKGGRSRRWTSNWSGVSTFGGGHCIHVDTRRPVLYQTAPREWDGSGSHQMCDGRAPSIAGGSFAKVPGVYQNTWQILVEASKRHRCFFAFVATALLAAREWLGPRFHQSVLGRKRATCSICRHFAPMCCSSLQGNVASLGRVWTAAHCHAIPLAASSRSQHRWKGGIREAQPGEVCGEARQLGGGNRGVAAVLAADPRGAVVWRQHRGC